MEKNNIYEMEAMDHGGAGSVSSVFCPYGCNFDRWNILYPIAHIRLLEFEKLHFWHTIIKIAKNSIMLHAWF